MICCVNVFPRVLPENGFMSNKKECRTDRGSDGRIGKVSLMWNGFELHMPLRKVVLYPDMDCPDFPRNDAYALCVFRIEQDIVYSSTMKRTVEAYSISIVSFAVFAN